MKRFLLVFFLLAGALWAAAQQQAPASPSLYDPSANAEKDIQDALARAAKEHKHVLLQAGGNWCGWCLRFNEFVTKDPQLDSLVSANYVVYHLNYSQENKNREQFEKYGFPQRFGFPVFVVLNAKGERLHTQNSAYLEQGKGYDRKKVVDFFRNWSPGALNPANYNY